MPRIHIPIRIQKKSTPSVHLSIYDAPYPMRICVLLTCVNYADFLRLTLPMVTRTFEHLFVLTAPDDSETQSLCRAKGVATFVTDVWRKRGAVFNKSAAITECLSAVTRNDDDIWILLLDADILLPESIDLDESRLDRFTLYSAPRRLCEAEKDWLRYRQREIEITAFPLDIPPIIDGKAWGKTPTTNPAGLMGYFQLWHLRALGGRRHLPPSRNAATYDIRFALLFPESKRAFLPFEVLHLGPIRHNWNGRVSVAWRHATDGEGE